MDLEEWEFLPEDGFLENHDDGGKKIFSRKYGSNLKNVFNMNYFICPEPQKIIESPGNSRVPNQLVPVTIQLEPATGKPPDHESEKEINKIPIEISIMPPTVSEKIKAPNIGAVEADQDTVCQVFFKKMKENEFVDMKMDSPKSSIKGIMPQIDVGTFQFEAKSEAMEDKNCSSKIKVERDLVTKKNSLDSDIKENVTWEESDGESNLWKRSLTGIGAICSFGIAAATMCIIIFGSHQRNKQHQQNQKLRFQFYTDDKRMKKVVHHATKLNEAISAVRGLPLTRAHITFGGYYDGL